MELDWKRLLPTLLINVVVSAGTILLVLFLWERFRGPQPSAVLPLPTGVAAASATQQSAEAAAGGAGAGNSAGVTPTPLTYVVQSGDTLGGIALTFDISVEELLTANSLANPDTLDVGQVLIIPREAAPVAVAAATAGPTPTPIATASLPTPSVDASLVVSSVEGAGQIDQERVVISNLGNRVQLVNWSLADADGNNYNFPALSLFSGGQITVHTRIGENQVTDIYWGLDEPIWQPGEQVRLIAPGGEVHATFDIP